VAGGIVLPLFQPSSPLLNAARLHERERYNHRAGAYDGSTPIRTVVNVHNPSIEAHILPAGAAHNTGAAVIVVGGGGHQVVGRDRSVRHFTDIATACYATRKHGIEWVST
jgi:hypothetical protein